QSQIPNPKSKKKKIWVLGFGISGLFVLRVLLSLGETLGEILGRGPVLGSLLAVVGRVDLRPLVVAGLEAGGARRRQRLARAGRRLARVAFGRVILALILDRLAHLLLRQA